MKKILLLLVSALFSLLATAQVFKTIDVTTAGTLSTLLTSTELSTVTNLTVTGYIDARDVKTMRDDMPMLAVLDMGAVSIMEYTGVATAPTYIGYTTYPANEIPQYSFYNNNAGKTTLKTINFPTNISSIGTNAFNGCNSLTGNLTLLNTLISIGETSFQNCSELITIYIPISVTSIGDAAFSVCNNLKDLVVLALNPNLSSLNGVLFDKNQTTIKAYPGGKNGGYIIPSSVTSIGRGAFMGCLKLTSIGIENSVTTIEDAAFYNCKGLKTLKIPNSITKIGVYAFMDCSEPVTIYCLSKIPPILQAACFSEVTSVTDIFVPTDDAVIAYKADISWGFYFKGDVIKKDNITKNFNHINPNLKVYTITSDIIIEGTSNGEIISLYNINGKQIQTIKSK